MTAPEDLRYLPEQLHTLHRDAYTLRHRDHLPWSAVADALDEPESVVRDWCRRYIDTTDAAAARAQLALFPTTDTKE